MSQCELKLTLGQGQILTQGSWFLKKKQEQQLQNTPTTKAFDRDVGITDMHIGDMLWAISGQYNIWLFYQLK
jgi:hypothetical protein